MPAEFWWNKALFERLIPAGMRVAYLVSMRTPVLRRRGRVRIEAGEGKQQQQRTSGCGGGGQDGFRAAAAG